MKDNSVISLGNEMSNMVVMFRLENNNTWLSTFVESGNFKIKVKSDVL